ncbi:hypothetical protein CTA2_4488 [Colletotrichum tanaceti]|uniref:Uncharacterized protein n=1 Tax=Colletotrichum tanaceti TaxID=1306861 RepID=A0A4U6X947_9PEZI|nr:hypothetical protein CTA2_4488 [Colletotrichum tanaceti]TKW51643.1 hypothetical protein CTA1_6291 [Colletotrichum tanaceti]
MVLADVEMSRMTVNEWQAATAPKFRRGLGLPCSVLDVGTLARKRKLREAMETAGAGFLTEQDVLEGLYLAIVRS